MPERKLTGSATTDAARLASRMVFRVAPILTSLERPITAAMTNGTDQNNVATKCAGSAGNVAVSQERSDNGRVDMATHTPAIDRTYRYGERDFAPTIANDPDTTVDTTTVQTQ